MSTEPNTEDDALDEAELEEVSGGTSGAYVVTSVSHVAGGQHKTTPSQYAETDLDFVRRRSE